MLPVVPTTSTAEPFKAISALLRALLVGAGPFGIKPAAVQKPATADSVPRTFVPDRTCTAHLATATVSAGCAPSGVAPHLREHQGAGAGRARCVPARRTDRPASHTGAGGAQGWPRCWRFMPAVGDLVRSIDDALDGAPANSLRPRSPTAARPDAGRQHRMLVRAASNLAVRVRRSHVRAGACRRLQPAQRASARPLDAVA